MKVTWHRVIELGLGSLTGPERDHTIVYLLERALAPGEDIEVDRRILHRNRPVAVLFVDLEPELNWSHRCRYILVDLDTGELEVLDATFPPFFRSVPPELRAVHLGANAPAWAVATHDQTQ